MDDFFEFTEEDETLNNLADRFEAMVKEGSRYFFDIEEYEDLIDHYLITGNLKMCGLAIGHSMEQYPGHTGFQIRQAQLLVSSNKAEKALRVLAKVEDIDPTNSEIYITKGAIYSQLKRYDDAIREYNKAIREDEVDLANIYSNIAFEYENLGNYDKAIEYLKKVLELEPDNESIIFELSFCFEISSLNEESIEYFTAFTDRMPYSKFAWFNLGVAYNNVELFEKAIQSFEFAIAIDPGFSSAYFNKANSLATMGLYRQAIDSYIDTFDYEEPEAFTYYSIADCYEKLSDFTNAITFFRKALDMDESMSEAWVGMGVCYDSIGNIMAAIRYIRRGLDLDPDNAEYLLTLASSQQNAGYFSEAAISYTRAAEINPLDPMLWTDFASLFAGMDEYDHALEIIETGLTHQPENSVLYYHKAAYLYCLGRRKQGMAALEAGFVYGSDGLADIFVLVPNISEDKEILATIDRQYPDLIL